MRETEPEIQKKLYRLAAELIEARYPHGWGGAAVLRTSEGAYYSSVAIETANAGASLCIEVGAMCEAHKYRQRVTHGLCLVREDEHSPFQVLSPCGICQERYRFWGTDVQVAVTAKDESLKFVPLSELQPYHWSGAYPDESLEHFSES